MTTAFTLFIPSFSWDLGLSPEFQAVCLEFTKNSASCHSVIYQGLGLFPVEKWSCYLASHRRQGRGKNAKKWKLFPQALSILFHA